MAVLLHLLAETGDELVLLLGVEALGGGGHGNSLCVPGRFGGRFGRFDQHRGKQVLQHHAAAQQVVDARQ